MPIKPKTKATLENLEAMRAETQRLFEVFGGPSGLSFVCCEHYKGTEHEGKFRRLTAGQWAFRGRVSADAAYLMDSVPKLARAGFSKESLRPDVVVWYDE